MVTTPKQKFDKVFWLLAYDLPAETRQGIDDDQRVFLNTQRLKVCRDLKDVFESYPLQQSIWILREPDKMIDYNDGTKVRQEKKLDVLTKYVEKWRADYAAKGFPDIVLDVWPIQVTAVGQSYIESSAVKWLFDNVLDCEKRIDKYIKEGVVKIRIANAIDGGLQWYQEVFRTDFGTNHPRWHEFMKSWMRVKDKLDDDLRPKQVS